MVAWSTLIGSLVPIGRRSLKLDPATILAPFLATFIDVTGLILYFGSARAMLNRKGHGRAAEVMPNDAKVSTSLSDLFLYRLRTTGGQVRHDCCLTQPAALRP